MRIEHTNWLEKANAHAGQRHSSSFIELVPHIDEGNGLNLTTKNTTASAKNLLSQFHNSIKFQFPDRIPFSILSCILNLPEKLSGWPKPKQLREMLSILLADCGFLFEEVRPVSKGQYSPQDLVSALNEKNHVLDTLRWTESTIISEVQERFWRQYRSSKEESDHIPDVLKKLEMTADSQEPGWFRRCVLELFRLSLQPGKLEPLSMDFIFFCQQRWNLSDEQLERTVWISHMDEESDKVTLRDALNKLFDIWNEVVHRYNAEHIKLERYFYLSEDAYQRCKTVRRLSKKIKRTLESPTFQICGSRKLPGFLKENVRCWYLECDGISQNKVYRKQLPQYLQYSSVQEMQLTDASTLPACVEIQRELEMQYIRYWGNRKGKEIESSEALSKSIEFILKISLIEAFSVHEEDPDDVAAIPISLSPVITFLIFYQYDFCANRALKQIRTDILFEPIKKLGNPDDIDLYRNLCCAYAKFYGNRDNQAIQAIQAEWDAAFIVYTGCHSLYPAASYLEENAGNLLVPSCFAGISNCLAGNKVCLAHNWLYQERGVLDHFDLEGAGESGRRVLSFFQDILLQQDSAQDDSWLKKFLAFLQYPYSHGAIRDFLMDCMDGILEDVSKRKGGTHKLNNIENTLRSLLPGVKDPKMRMCAALEYTMRKILADRCKDRLYNWLFDYFDWQFDVLQGEAADEAD